MDDKTFEMTMLYDFFGDLLTDKMKLYFDLYYNNDLSLSEIAEQTGISRQGVRDNIMRAQRQLREYEEKTGIVARFIKMQDDISSITHDLNRIIELSDGEVNSIAKKTLGKVCDLKG